VFISSWEDTLPSRCLFPLRVLTNCTRGGEWSSKKQESRKIFVCFLFWRLKVLQSQCLVLAFKTLWSLGLAISKSQTVSSSQRKTLVSLSRKVSHLSFTTLVSADWQNPPGVTCDWTFTGVVVLITSCYRPGNEPIDAQELTVVPMERSAIYRKRTESSFSNLAHQCM